MRKIKEMIFPMRMTKRVYLSMILFIMISNDTSCLCYLDRLIGK